MGAQGEETVTPPGCRVGGGAWWVAPQRLGLEGEEDFLKYLRAFAALAIEGVCGVQDSGSHVT